MAQESPYNPLPLDYERHPPAAGAPRAPSVPGPARGTLAADEATVPVLETLDRANMAFACRALDRGGIPYRVADAPSPTGAYKHPLRLLVRPGDAAGTRELVRAVVERRERAKELNRPKDPGFKTRSEGGTWPDPFSHHGGGGGVLPGGF